MKLQDMDKVECEIELTSSTTTTFKFNVAPALDDIKGCNNRIINII